MKTFTDFLGHLIKWEKMLLVVTAYDILLIILSLFARDEHGIKFFLLPISIVLLVPIVLIYKREYKHWKRWGC